MEVFVLQPEGFLVQGCVDKVYKLRKALYELRQALRAWYTRLITTLFNMDLKGVKMNQHSIQRSKEAVNFWWSASMLMILYIWVCVIQLQRSSRMG